jgi:hypothetical protein
VSRLSGWIAGALGFAALATLNAGGYRYGISDQAFYIPAVLQKLDPTLFPRDAALIVSQGRFTIFEEIFAWLIRATGWPLPIWFVLCYAVGLLLLYAALVQLGRLFYASTWGVVALLFACTLKHRIIKTGVNTLEGYFQPRMLVFAIGLLAVGAVLKRRTALAWTLLLAGVIIHTTTALWFVVWVGVALAVEDRRQRKWVIGLGVAGAIGGLALLWRGLLSLAPMDDAWLRAFEAKDYIFPTQWTADAWLLNLILMPGLVLGAFLWRRRAGLLLPGEAGVVTGCLTLVGLFVLALPFIAARSALVAELQVSRLFWMNDLMATLYVVWFATEAVPRGGAAAPARRAMAVAAVLGLLAVARGGYVLTIDHPERSLVEIDLPPDEWIDASRWIQANTPTNAHLLADPGHAWRYGFSLRVSAERDVLLEDVKDSAIALYGRPIAMRVNERREALGDFETMTAARALALASRYDLTYLVTEAEMPLPEVYRNARFHVYRLAAAPLAGSAPDRRPLAP